MVIIILDMVIVVHDVHDDDDDVCPIQELKGKAQPRHPFLSIAHGHHHLEHGDRGVNDDDDAVHDVHDDDDVCPIQELKEKAQFCYKRQRLDTPFSTLLCLTRGEGG